MSKLKIAVAGSSGRMGRALLEAVLQGADTELGGALDVVARAGGDVVHEDFLGDAAAHQNGELRFEVVLVVRVLVVQRQLHGQAQRHSARNDGETQLYAGFNQAGHFFF